MLGGDPFEHADARRQRLVEQVAPVEVQHVEEPRMQHRGARRVCPEPRHGLLERSRAAVLVEGEGLAVEDHIAHRQSTHHLHHLRQAVGHLGQGACVDAHIIADAMHLDARPVELVFHGCLPRSLQRRARAGRGCGEHRLHGPADN